MPFKNKAQVRACFAQYSRDIKAGRVPSWDCYKWMKETKSPIRSAGRVSKRRSNRKRLSPKKSPRRRVYVGPRGGRYVIVDGHKVYV